MTTLRAPTRRVYVRVAPRLLSDALSMVLQSEEVEVVLDLDDATAVIEGAEPFAMALVTGALPPELAADVVVVLDDAGTRARIHPRGQEVELARGDELTSLVDLVRAVLG